MIDFLFGDTRDFELLIVISTENHTTDTHKLSIENNKPTIHIAIADENKAFRAEKIRLSAIKCLNTIRDFEAKTVAIHSSSHDLFPFLEGVLFNSYQFEKNKSKKTEEKRLSFILPEEAQQHVSELMSVFKWVNQCRDWVNEPFNVLNAQELANRMADTSALLGLKATVFEKDQIAAEKMGGLLAVNRGSANPPTFTMIEYKPAKPLNAKPVVFVGKGVVMDTGGYTIKDTPNSMEIMKCDMAGGAIVANTLFAAAEMQLPIWCVSLVPATDNMIGPNALVPGEIISMKGGKTVEVLNSDAEGRLILADALVFAQQFEPGLVIDVATLTGSAIAAIGQEGAVMCTHEAEPFKPLLEEAATLTHERFVELPLWAEFEEEVKSNIADLKNIGTSNYAGAITAAAFLKQFTAYPWVHLDVAGPVYSKSKRKYFTEGASGYGVRLLLAFLKAYSDQLKTKQ